MKKLYVPLLTAILLAVTLVTAVYAESPDITVSIGEGAASRGKLEFVVTIKDASAGGHDAGTLYVEFPPDLLANPAIKESALPTGWEAGITENTPENLAAGSFCVWVTDESLSAPLKNGGSLSFTLVFDDKFGGAGELGASEYEWSRTLAGLTESVKNPCLPAAFPEAMDAVSDGRLDVLDAIAGKSSGGYNPAYDYDGDGALTAADTALLFARILNK